MAKLDQLKRSYEFLTMREDANTPFNLKELCDATGWKPATPKTYLTKKWLRFVRPCEEGWMVEGVTDLSLEEYLQYMSQVASDDERPRLSPAADSLARKAQEAATMAVDVYNRPGTRFRTQAFVMLMTVAWTSATHAVLEDAGEPYFHVDDDGEPLLIDGDQKAWELSECLRKLFGGSQSGMRANLEFMIKLRNKIEHRFVPEIDGHVAGECQAMLLNFERFVSERLGGEYVVGESLYIPLQLTAGRTDAQSTALRRFHADNYDEVKDFVDAYRMALPEELYQDPAYAFRVYLIPKIGNHASSSDTAFEFVRYDPSNPDDMDSLRRQVALIRERRVAVANLGRYLPTAVAEEVARRLHRKFGIHQHSKAWRYYAVREPGTAAPDACKTQYCQFDEAHREYVYTQAWIDHLVEKLSDADEYERVCGKEPVETDADG